MVQGEGRRLTSANKCKMSTARHADTTSAAELCRDEEDEEIEYERAKGYALWSLNRNPLPCKEIHKRIVERRGASPAVADRVVERLVELVGTACCAVLCCCATGGLMR
jgi:hypothetical protein